MFNVDFDKLVLWLLPDFIRKPVLYAWVRSLCYPVVKQYEEFSQNRVNNLYKLNHTSQVFSITKVLNDRFDKNERRIYITDGFTKERIYLHTNAEYKPKYLSTPIYLHNPEDYADTGVDFIVWLPNAVEMTPENLIEARAQVDFYKRGAKRYKIYRI